MNPLDYRIQSDPRRKGDGIDLDATGEVAGLQLIFSLLYVNRGRRLSGAVEDGEKFEIPPKEFFDKVHALMKLGAVELNGNEIFLPVKPRTILDRLADIKK